MKKKTPPKKTAKPAPKKVSKQVKEKPKGSPLANGFKSVELSFEEALDAFKRKQESRLALLREAVSKKAPAAKAKKGGCPNEKKMASKIAGLKVKPKKGRAKDLLRIEKLLEELMELIPQE